jgi:hypothetical protein
LDQNHSDERVLIEDNRLNAQKSISKLEKLMQEDEKISRRENEDEQMYQLLQKHEVIDSMKQKRLSGQITAMNDKLAEANEVIMNIMVGKRDWTDIEMELKQLRKENAELNENKAYEAKMRGQNFDSMKRLKLQLKDMKQTNFELKQQMQNEREAMEAMHEEEKWIIAQKDGNLAEFDHLMQNQRMRNLTLQRSFDEDEKEISALHAQANKEVLRLRAQIAKMKRQMAQDHNAIVMDEKIMEERNHKLADEDKIIANQMMKMKEMRAEIAEDEQEIGRLNETIKRMHREADAQKNDILEMNQNKQRTANEMAKLRIQKKAFANHENFGLTE